MEGVRVSEQFAHPSSKKLFQVLQLAVQRALTNQENLVGDCQKLQVRSHHLREEMDILRNEALKAVDEDVISLKKELAIKHKSSMYLFIICCLKKNLQSTLATLSQSKSSKCC